MLKAWAEHATLPDFRKVVAITLTATAIAPINGAAQTAATRKQTVVVTGHGATVAEARNDAVRQALEQVVQQLVFADLRTVNDKIVLDRIMSTMNGYVDDRRLLSKHFDATGKTFTLTEEITVSTTRIANFLGVALGASVEISGGLLNTDATREIMQRDSRGIIFDRLLTGLPGSAIDLVFGNPTPDQRDLNQFNFPVTATISKAWLSSLRTGLKAMAVDTLSGTSDDNTINSNSLLKVMKGPEGSSSFCIVDARSAECFLLPPGHYGRTSMIGRQEAELDFMAPPLLLALRFVDGRGATTIVGNAACLVRAIKFERFRVGMLRRHWGQGPLNRQYYLDTTPVAGTFTIKASEVNLGETKKFAGVPLFGARQFGTYVSMHSGNVQRLDDPTLLFVPDMAGGPVSRTAACGEPLDDALLVRR